MTLLMRWKAELCRFVILVAITLSGLPVLAAPATRVDVSFPTFVHQQPITGRAFVVLTTSKDKEPRLQAGSRFGPSLLFGIDVAQLNPGEAAVIDGDALGFPFRSLRELPAGTYYVQALLSIYTQCHRSDGHAVWVHLDQWEGQRFNASPGNLYSDVQQVHLDPTAGFALHFSLNRIIPPVKVPPDTEWVKHIKFQSKRLSEFWGCPIFMGATVLLPKGYDSHPAVHYPVIYLQSHFSLDAPFGFNPEAEVEQPRTHPPRRNHRRLNVSEPSKDWHLVSEALMMPETPAEFYRAWTSADFPRVIAVTFQHPMPYFDDSYAVNSANNGPYGDAIMKDLIPSVEERFRIIRKSYARVLTGGSTGGWESLALQVYHPDFFGGTWTLYPDPVDFRRWSLINIYDDNNAFTDPHLSLVGGAAATAERYLLRGQDGQPLFTIRQETNLESVLGSKGRSGRQQNAWEAVYGPVGEDGYPVPLWDPKTGKIDHSVAAFMKGSGYDLRDYLETNWPTIGPRLVGKLHLICGDMDNWYLNLAVYLLEDFLANTTHPYYAGSFEYGRPLKGHGWQPTTDFALIQRMAEQISRNAPHGDDPKAWHYK
jgi:hypothetical protein